LLALDVERASPGQRGRQRLRTAHAAQTSGQDPFAREIVVVVLFARFHKRLEGALHDALAADVDPATGRHLAVHEQALAVEFAEVFPVGPLGHQVAVGQQHARRIGVGFEHTHRFARLDQQRLVVAQVFERGQDLVERGPVARGAANAAVNHQVLRVFGDLGIEVVLQHAVGGFGDPVFAVQGVAPWGADHPAGVPAGVGVQAHGVSLNLYIQIVPK
jgi:hypothetical protein